MTTGQRERIVYRAVVRGARSGSFLPPHGVGYGLGDDLGIILNRTIRGPTNFRATRRTAVGLVVEEDTNSVIVELRDGRKLKIPRSDIIKRRPT